MRLSRVLAVLSLVLAGAGTGCSPAGETAKAVRDPGVLVLATTPETAAHGTWDAASGSVLGLDLEIVRQAAARLGRTLEIREMPFPEILPAVKRGAADVAAATIAIKPSRLKDVDFSDPYASDGSAFLYHVGARVPTIPWAVTMRVGAQTASVSQFYLATHDVDSIGYDRHEDALRDFAAGRLDAIFDDAETLRHSLKRGGGAWALTDLETREHYGVAVRKGEPEILAAVNDVIRSRKEAR